MHEEIEKGKTKCPYLKPLDYLQQTPYPTTYLTPYFKLHSMNSAITVQNSTLHDRLHGLLEMALVPFSLYLK
jgi:hypothetical protein